MNDELHKLIENESCKNELLDALMPFYLHAKALEQSQQYSRGEGLLKDVYNYGNSGLTWGAFDNVIDIFEGENNER